MRLLVVEEAVRGVRWATADEQPSEHRDMTYRDAISVFLADTLSFRLALLEGVLVLELGPHGC